MAVTYSGRVALSTTSSGQNTDDAAIFPISATISISKVAAFTSGTGSGQISYNYYQPSGWTSGTEVVINLRDLYDALRGEHFKFTNIKSLLILPAEGTGDLWIDCNGVGFCFWKETGTDVEIIPAGAWMHKFSPVAGFTIDSTNRYLRVQQYETGTVSFDLYIDGVGTKF